MPLITNNDQTDAKSRIVGIRLALLTLRLRNNWKEALGDADLAAIVLAIVAIRSERLMRVEIAPGFETLMMPMPEEALADCNVSSIAAATGINRETTRRKVQQLVEAGVVVRDGISIGLAPGFTQQEAVIATVKAQLDELRRTTNDLLRHGVLDVAE